MLNKNGFDPVERTAHNYFLTKKEQQKRIKIMRPTRMEEQNNDD